VTIFQAIILGVVQGLTEFLPVSSSAHLVLTPYLLGWQISAEQEFIFDVLVQMGTLAAVIVYFWRDLWEIITAFVKGIVQRKSFENQNSRLAWYLILATVPAGALGLTVKKVVEAAFDSVTMTGVFLLATALLLALAEVIGKRTRIINQITWLDALWIGCFQAISIFPGVSRSGATITGAMTRHLERGAAARFSFLMSIPVMLAAGLLEIIDLMNSPILADFLPAVITGFVAAGVVGYLSIHWFLKYLARRSLFVFSGYCAVIGVLVIILTVL
jgi:undecaprenyl-diphosphatase